MKCSFADLIEVVSPGVFKGVFKGVFMGRVADLTKGAIKEHFAVPRGRRKTGKKQFWLSAVAA